MTNQNSLINPYELLGVTTNSSIDAVRKAYYNLALLCHPDKGGSAIDMIIICKAYNYVKNQIVLNVDEEKMNMEVLEQEFKDFCTAQESKSPTFEEIYKETNIESFLLKFNQAYENNMSEGRVEENESAIDPFKLGGYGEYMEESKSNNRYNANVSNQPMLHRFKNELVVYKEPCNAQTSYGYQPFDVKHIEDYSHKSGSLDMFDYMKSYSKELQPDIELKEKSYDQVLEERKKMDIMLSKNVDRIFIGLDTDEKKQN